MEIPNGNLTDQRRLFVEEYLSCWNATEAARRAKYKNPNKIGPRLVKVGVIQDLIQQRLAEKAMTAEEVLFRLGEQARSDVADFIDATSKRVFLLNMDKVKASGHLIRKIKYTKDGPEIELYSSQRALELMGKHFALFTERIELGGEDGGPLTLRVIYGNDNLPEKAARETT